MSRKLISIDQAIKKSVDCLRKPIWANKMDHFKIDIIDGRVGPWVHFYSPMNKEVNKRDPVDLPIWDWCPSFDISEFEIYEGPLPDSEEYQREVAQYEGVFK